LVLPVLAGLILAGALFATDVQAAPDATLTVDTLSDGVGTCGTAGDCTLRAAIAAAAPGDTIVFAPSLAGGTIVLASKGLTISQNLVISSNVPITISGNNAVRVFHVTAGEVTFDGLTIINGKPVFDGLADGAGIRVASGATAIVMNSILANNFAGNGGGAIYNGGTLRVIDTTLSGNHADGPGGAIYSTGIAMVSGSTLFSNASASLGGGVSNYAGQLTMVNSTVAGNSATAYGGGLFSLGSITLTSSTLTGNASPEGGGMYVHTDATMVNTVVAGSTSGGDCRLGFEVVALNRVVNTLIEDSGTDACNLSSGTDSNIIGSSPLLGALADNGGATMTQLPQTGSPTIDAGDCTSGPATDQRGVVRPQDTTCDIGAVEVARPMLTVTLAGSGSGSASSSPAGIDCGATCTAGFSTGTTIMLTAAPDSGSTFAGWSGACRGTGSCSLTLSADQVVTATFTLIPPMQPAQAQTMCYGANIGLTIEMNPAVAAAAQQFDLVVISGPAPTNLFLEGAEKCVPYTGFSSMVDLTNDLVTQGCPGSAACNVVSRVIFAPNGSYTMESINKVWEVSDLFLPAISNTCVFDAICQ